MVRADPAPPPRVKPPAWRHWLGIGLRTAHLAAVCLLGAGLLGAGHPAVAWGAPATLATGVALFASELVDGRVRAGDLAGLVVIAKLAGVAWMALDPPAAAPVFWVLFAVSSAASHAPRPLRHWRPGGRRSAP